VLTRWGRDLDPDHPLPEHPRPQLVRDSAWVSLNGRWSYAFGDRMRPERWDGEIVVPFSPEAPLSGVGRQLQPDEWLWYRRTGIEAPRGERVLLHFGAVDQSCSVWVNGVEVGSHVGGYLPFSFDITGALVAGTQTIEVRVRDLSDTGPHARGKQRLDRGRIWYTAQSGIWQTVWLEAVPDEYVASLLVVPDLGTGTFTVTFTTSKGHSHTETITPAEPRLWSPADPFLHEFEIAWGEDRVRSYAALRAFGIDEDRRFTLNGEPIQHVGVLDQGYWPDGLLTPPADEAMVHDITAMKDLGFTMLRKHVKIEPLRWYHHCDRLGMLVWQDMVNGGGRYRHLVTDLPARRPVRLSDRHYRLFFREDATARDEFRAEVTETVRLLRNVASIAVWTPFNEGWGQFDANEIAALVKELDPTRTVNHVSGWIDQGGGEVKSHHSYLRPFRLRRRRRDRRVQALTEYGGYSLRVEGHDWSDIALSDQWSGYRHCETPDELAAAFTALHRDQIEPAIDKGLGATVYTQLSDVEDELNGLFTWDREVLKLPADLVRETLRRLRS
jgi:beta-galactosidase/beta-glucuronidase